MKHRNSLGINELFLSSYTGPTDIHHHGKSSSSSEAASIVLNKSERKKLHQELRHRLNLIKVSVERLDKSTHKIISFIEALHQSAVSSLNQQAEHYNLLLEKAEFTARESEEIADILKSTFTLKPSFKFHNYDVLINHYKQEFAVIRLKVDKSPDKTEKTSEMINYIAKNHGFYLDSSDSVNCITMSNDSKVLVTGCNEGTIRVWNMKTHVQKAQMKADNLAIINIAISTNKKYIVTSNSKAMQLFNYDTKSFEGEFKGDFIKVTSLVITNDNKHVLACCSKANSQMAYHPIIVLSIETRKELYELSSEYITALCVAVSANNEYIISGCGDFSLRVWNFRSREVESVFQGHTKSVIAVEISKSSTYALSAALDYTIKIWNIKKKAFRITIHTELDNNYMPKSLCLTHSSKLYIGTYQGKILTWNFHEKVFEDTALEGHTKSVKQVFVTNDDLLVVACTEDSTEDQHNKALSIWNVNEKTTEEFFQGHIGSVTCVAFSNNYELLASGSIDRTVRLWNVCQKLQILILEGHTDTVTCVGISENNKYAVSGSNDRTIRLWNLRKQRCDAVFEGHQDSIDKVLITHDNLWVISHSKDKTGRVWNVKLNKEEMLIKGQKELKVWSSIYPQIDEAFESDKNCLLF